MFLIFIDNQAKKTINVNKKLSYRPFCVRFSFRKNLSLDSLSTNYLLYPVQKVVVRS